VHRNKKLLIMIVVLTVIWSSIAFWHFKYLRGDFIGLRGLIGPDIIVPFWLVVLICLIGWSVTILLTYFLLSMHGFWDK
jgi:hypothetical protein